MTYYVLLVDAYIDRRPGRVVVSGLRRPHHSGRDLYSIPHLAHRPAAGGAAPRAHTNTNGHVILCNYIKIPRGVPVGPRAYTRCAS